MKKLLAYACLFIMLSACGFHLRGLNNVPKWLDNVSVVDHSANKDITNAIISVFKIYDIKVNPDPALGKYWLVIPSAGYKQQISSVGSGSNPRQYQLIYAVDFLLQTPKGEIIAPLRHIEITRQLTVNNDRVLGSNSEANLFLNEMRKDAAVQILNRLSHDER